MDVSLFSSDKQRQTQTSGDEPDDPDYSSGEEMAKRHSLSPFSKVVKQKENAEKYGIFCSVAVLSNCESARCVE